MATESAPWQIKSMPIGTREKAVRYAKMRGETMAEWMARAVDTKLVSKTVTGFYRRVNPSKPINPGRCPGSTWRP